MWKFKKTIFKLLNEDGGEYRPARVVNLVIVGLILVNTVLVILDTFDYFTIYDLAIFVWLDVAISVIFTVEYFLRLWVSDMLYPSMQPGKARLRYARSFMAIVDLLAIVPFYLPYVFTFDFKVIRMIRILRLIRILKVNRYTDALSTIRRVITKKTSQLVSSLFIILLLILIASIIMYGLESEAQPEVFKNAFSGMWWAISTLLTVAYGDIYPITVMGKVLSSLIAFLGVALIAVPTGIVSAGFVELRDDNKHVSNIGRSKTKNINRLRRTQRQSTDRS